MSCTYLFFRPARLPLATDELSATTVLELDDPGAVQADLERVIPGIVWAGSEGRGDFNGSWVEFHLDPDVGTLSMRCSLRADYSELVQRLCDELAWVAFDERSVCYQPHRPPMPA